ncbi:MAG: four helix bundle protein [Candidatus Fischerbacteria bacterium RBG_13_37_8]|uniref:Four helix bundle protein n=1 Tax=Candidatus Fischerbacteria bacterium RBG_13_37_8 TaxID=1817863 RepID=A0A1F5VMS2_9BACT|nr:MAG: four helix bundle protein [Candidatus Fischerbacteria bacterium RBG_13_37_8]
MKTYRELIVWQKAMELVTHIYKLSKSFPKEESFGLTSQMRRSAVSIPANVAEGYGRKSTQDYLRFLNIARSSTYELQTLLEIANNLNYITSDSFSNVFEKSKEIERMLSALIAKISRS